MSIDLGLVIDLCVAGLLLATLVWAIRLDRRLKDLRSGKDGMRQTIIDLSAAAERATRAIAELRATAEGAGAELSQRITKAKALCDDLALVAGAADGLAQRLAHRSAASPQPQPRAAAPADTLLRQVRGAR